MLGGGNTVFDGSSPSALHLIDEGGVNEAIPRTNEKTLAQMGFGQQAGIGREHSVCTGGMASEEQTTTDAERWLVIDGRRWRRTDPALPGAVADRLRSHLGRARAAVRTGGRAGDDDAVAAARHRVGLAKAGLGERGPRWWDDEVEARVARARDAVTELDRLAPPREEAHDAGADDGPGVNA